MKLRFVISFLQFIIIPAFGQLTLEDIFLSSKYREKHPENLNFMINDSFYTVQEGNSILKKETVTGRVVDTLISKSDTINKGKFSLFDYSFSHNENVILLAGNREGIYRRSFLADYVFYNCTEKTFKSIHIANQQSGKIGNVEFSPNDKKVAFVWNNNLYSNDLSSNETEQITFDGKSNVIINGSTDWVYEEEFEFTKAYKWSQDSKIIAFLKFDESEVPDYNMQKWTGIYPENYVYKYPKAGEKNSKVTLNLYNTETKKTTEVSTDSLDSYYVPRFIWAENQVLFLSLNRQQTKLSITKFDPITNKSSVILSKQFPTSIELDPDLYYSENSNTLFFSGKVFNDDGLFSINCGKNPNLKKLINQNDLEIDCLDDKNKFVYYTSPTLKPEERDNFRISLKTKKIEKLSINSGSNKITVSLEGNIYIIANNSTGVPTSFATYNAKTKNCVRILEDNQLLKDKIESLNLPDQTFLSVKTSEQIVLNGWTIKPPLFDSTQKYPVIMFVYGGPGSQMVKNFWTGSYYLWHQFLASKGFIVACFDGRGTGGKGNLFQKVTYGKLGELETKDQVEVAKYLSRLDYVDSLRIGIWGWSFGGYLSTNSLLIGNNVFKTAIAVAPVTSWRFYDTIYSERYLNLPKDNAAGYDNNSPIMYAEKLKGKYLLIHGTSDDNVHIQNAFAMQEALIKAGKEFESFIYPNKNHGISGGNTRYHLYSKMFDFWNRNLK
ncbi:MAG: DPP IV N-terminal domain-containing protein [Opitutaceae bacterium]|nr:DPP IV N-terminal domain-containing protein [Cytophagales bacterium]